jgi:hypothetical protein
MFFHHAGENLNQEYVNIKAFAAKHRFEVTKYDEYHVSLLNELRAKNDEERMSIDTRKRIQ